MLPRIVIDHCVIAVSDWERSNAFYRDVLGAQVDQKDDRFGDYRFGDWQLNVHRPGFAGLRGDSGAGGRGRHVYFRDPDGSLLELVSYR